MEKSKMTHAEKDKIIEDLQRRLEASAPVVSPGSDLVVHISRSYPFDSISDYLDTVVKAASPLVRMLEGTPVGIDEARDRVVAEALLKHALQEVGASALSDLATALRQVIGLCQQLAPSFADADDRKGIAMMMAAADARRRSENKDREFRQLFSRHLKDAIEQVNVAAAVACDQSLMKAEVEVDTSDLPEEAAPWLMQTLTHSRSLGYYAKYEGRTLPVGWQKAN